MKSTTKKLKVLLLTLILIFTMAVPALAADGCASWKFTGEDNYCSTPMCVTNTARATYYVSFRYERFCVRPDGSTYKEYKRETTPGACCPWQ